MIIAVTRQVSRSMYECELTHLVRTPIDFKLARLQHQRYEETLRDLGLDVISLPEEPQLPDSVFVEDTAVVLDECAVITRPGAISRRSETETVASTLLPYRELRFILPPATLDGGDVLCIGRQIFIGLTERTNISAVEQMRKLLAEYGYAVSGFQVSGCLHLKSAVTQVTGKTLLINPAWVEKGHFPGMNFLEIDPSEPYAANALLIGDSVIYTAAFPMTCRHLKAAGIEPLLVDFSEFAKAEGAVTCCSLIFKV